MAVSLALFCIQVDFFALNLGPTWHGHSEWVCATFNGLVGFRVLQGAGAAIIFPVGVGVVSRWMLPGRPPSSCRTLQ